jgi:gas vesicle protein
MNIFQDPKFLVSILIAILSLVINVVQQLTYKQVKNKIRIWSKDAKGMATSIIGMQENIKEKKITSLSDVSSNLETLGNFANSMYTSMEEEMGNTKKDITKQP